VKLDLLYHWAPATRRQAIAADGLRIGQEPTTCTQAVDYLCLAVDPRRAWALTGDLDWTPGGEWDLWHVELDSEYDVRLRVEDGQLIEVMVGLDIPAKRLWLLGTRPAKLVGVLW
jgi:hypothetical protein